MLVKRDEILVASAFDMQTSDYALPCLILGCGGELFDSRGTISSPRFDDGYYPDSTTCKWRIVSGDKRKKIKIKFTAFEVNCLINTIDIIMYASLNVWELSK